MDHKDAARGDWELKSSIFCWLNRKLSYWPYLIAGLVMGVVWFWYNRQIDFGPYPNQADAVNYAEISNSFRSFGEAFTYAQFRTYGFPFFLYVIKRVTEWFTVLSPEALHSVQTCTLLLIHFLSTCYFYRELRNFSETHGLRLHPSVLLLIIAHPGLVSHASVLLTDTFATNLVMIAGVLLLQARVGSNRALILRGALTGLVLGWAVATRPFLIAGLVSAIFITLIFAAWSRQLARFFLVIGPLACGMGLMLLPAVLSCEETYGRVCMQNPQFASGAGATSLRMGLTSYRTYWSIRSRWTESTTVMPNDWSMAETLGSACDINAITGPGSWLQCILSRPLFIPIYAGKKLIAVFDSFVLQPYASDVTPAWARHYGRIFGTLSFIGFFCAIGILLYFARHRMIWQILVFSVPVSLLIFQIPMHVEGRYSFPTVPLSLASLIWVFQIALLRGRRAVVTYVLIATILGGTFLAQTHAWDLDDLILQQIEGQDR